jgi:TPR repeat protein
MILGLLYSQGKGGPRDCKQANRFFQRACRLGNRQACHKRCSTNRDDWLP